MSTHTVSASTFAVFCAQVEADSEEEALEKAEELWRTRGMYSPRAPWEMSDVLDSRPVLEVIGE